MRFGGGTSAAFLEQFACGFFEGPDWKFDTTLVSVCAEKDVMRWLA